MKTLTGTIPTRVVALWFAQGLVAQKADGRLDFDPSVFGETERLWATPVEMTTVRVGEREYSRKTGDLLSAVEDLVIYGNDNADYSWIQVKPSGEATPIV